MSIRIFTWWVAQEPILIQAVFTFWCVPNTPSVSAFFAGYSNICHSFRTFLFESAFAFRFPAEVAIVGIISIFRAFLPAQGTSTFVTILTKRVTEPSFAFFTSWAYSSHLASTATLCTNPTGKVAGDVAANRPHYNRDHPGERSTSVIPIFIIDLICHVLNDLDDVTHIA